MASQLSAGQRDRLEALEMIIRHGIGTFCEVGNALKAIMEQKLYLEYVETFDDYMVSRWGMSARHGYRQIQAAEVVNRLKESPLIADLRPIGHTAESEVSLLLPECESQVRPLVALPPKEQPAAWRAAVEEAKAVPTAKVVRRVARQFIKCDRCQRLGTPVKDCPRCKALRKGTPNKPSPVKPPRITSEGGFAGACREALEAIYKRFGVAHDTNFQAILLSAHDLDDAISERARQLEVGPEEEPLKPPSENTAYRFDAFWKAYPRKTSRKDAEKAFNKLDPSREVYLQIMNAVENQKTWDGWKDGYIPEAARWLNGEKWNDEKPKRKCGQMSGLQEWAERTAGAPEHDQS